MTKIKFKKILKEAAWDHTSGKALPTLDDVQKAYNEKKPKLDMKEGLDRRALGLLNNKDVKMFKTACDGIAMEMADDGYDLGDVQDFLKEYARQCGTEGYKKAVASFK